MIRRSAAVLPPLLLAATLLAGCGEQEPTPASSGEADTAASETSPDAGGPAAGESPATGGDEASGSTDLPADTEPDLAEPSGDGRATVTDIRTGRHEGFDRVVFEVGGAGTPGWDVRYVDQASSQGSGDPVEVAGQAVLQVTLTGMGYPFDTGVEEWSGPDPLPGAGTEMVTEVAWDATFEGTSVAFIGTTARAPFRVYLLEEPARVVVEVGDPA